MIAGDFNRHDVLWGGDLVAFDPREADPILNLMAELNLQSLLPRGRNTWESEGRNLASTIDLMLTSPILTEWKMHCDLHPTRYGSDHRAIDSTFALDIPHESDEPRLNFNEAPWTDIRTAVKTKFHRITRQSPLRVSQILTVRSDDADASRVESGEKATELTGSLWPSSVCRQALHSSLIAGFIMIHFGSSSLKRPLIRLRAGLNTSADVYA
jgi:Endonuclease-reverse transcriptase